MGRLSEENLLRLEFVWGVTDIVLQTVGLYFIYRYCITVMVLDDEDKDLLLGPVVSKWIPANDEVVVLLGAAYISFKIVSLLITSTNWEVSLVKRTNTLRLKQPYRKQEVDEGNILAPKKLTLRDFTSR